MGINAREAREMNSVCSSVTWWELRRSSVQDLARMLLDTIERGKRLSSTTPADYRAQLRTSTANVNGWNRSSPPSGKRSNVNRDAQ